MSVRVLLVDNHRIMREGLRSLLSRQSDLEVVGEAEDGRTAIQLARKLRPGVVVMDISMPDLNGVDAIRGIISEVLGTKVIGLTMHSDRRMVARMLQAGASGYLLKDCDLEELVRAIRAVAAGQTYLSPVVAGFVTKEFVQYLATRDQSSSLLLTAREREVLQLIAEGHSTRDAAGRLHVSVKTVETHRMHIMRKLKAHSVAELTKAAIAEGLTTIDE
jgi:DNA-binding NarL/FixJ family response regulator